MSKSKISPMPSTKATRLKIAATTSEEPKQETPVATETTTTQTVAKPDSKSKGKGKANKPVTDAPAKLSCLDAAAKVLSESDTPLNTKAMIEAMAAKKLWTSPGGKTPAATLYSAILREIDVKKAESRFRKVSKGHFEATGN